MTTIPLSEGLLLYCSSSIRAYSDTLLLANNGLWTLYDGSRRSQSVLNNVSRKAIFAGNDLYKDLKRHDLADLEVGLLSAMLRGEIPKVAPDGVDSHPVIPFNDGSHLHLDRGQRENCRCDLRPLLLLDHGWDIPAPDWDLLDLPPMMFGQFPQAFFEAIARHLWGTSKDADFLACPISNAGKSTMASALAHCLPGAVVVKQAHTTLTAQRRKFSAHTSPLTNAKIVIYDECGKVAADAWTETLFELTPPELDIEHKGVDVVSRPRFGNAVMMGECPPAVDASVQGVESRIGYTADVLLTPIDGNTRREWLSATEISRLRTWMLSFALDATLERRDAEYHKTVDRSEIIAGLLPEGVAALRLRFEGNGGKWLSNKALTDAMEAEGIDVPAHKAFGKFVRSCWPYAEASKQADGRGYRGIGA